MKPIKRLVTAVAVAAGTGFGAQAAIAGSGCDHAGMKLQSADRGYQPAIYQPDSVHTSTARAYTVGMGYGHDDMAKARADIVDTASEAGSFSTLITAVKAADLLDTLKGPGPFTVLAPTDEAFARLPEAQLQALLADKAALTKVLTYHVLPGKVEAADVVKLSSAATVEGQSVTIRAGDSVMINNAKVIQADIITSNGVIHVIDTVMLPPDMVSQL